MPRDVEQAYADGLPLEGYRTRMRVHIRAFSDQYERLAFVREEQTGQAPLGTCRILILTEDYCIDSLLNVPLIARLVEASPGAQLRIASRDAHAELAGCFPGRDGVSRLPTVIILGRSGQVLGYWSERSKRDHAWMKGFVARDPMPELTLNDGRPTPTLANWMERRLASQRPFFETHSWRDVRDELRVIANAATSKDALA